MEPERTGHAAAMQEMNPCKIENRHPAREPLKNSSHQQLMKSLFGVEAFNWPFSEDSFHRSIELRIHQEKTKQEYYKVEKLNRIIELLKLAAVAKIPGHLIPSLLDNSANAFSNNDSFMHELGRESPPQSRFGSCANTSTSTPTTPPSPSRIRSHHMRSKTLTDLGDFHMDSTQQISNTQQSYEMKSPNGNSSMKNFRFGSGSAFKTPILSPRHIKKKRTTLPPKHQLSPSRIGAHAVSSLNRNGKAVNIMDLRHGTRHKRTLSLPVTVSIPESKTLSFHSERKEQKLNQIFIPDLSCRSDQQSKHIGTSFKTDHENTYLETIIGNTNADNSLTEDAEDVDLLLNRDSSFSPEGSATKECDVPLRNPPMILKEGETLAKDESNNNSIMEVSDANIPTVEISSPSKLYSCEPKTP